MRIKIAMALMSVVFMFVVGILSNGFYLLPGTDEDVLLELMSTISLFGSVLFVLEARKVLPRWHMAVPFCVSLFLLVIVSFWKVSGTEFLSDYRYLVTPIVITLLALLSPFSLLVFLSLHRHPYSMKAYLAVSSIASVISIFSLFFAVWELSSRHSHEASFSDGLIAIYLLYWLIVMPIIGLSFLHRAIK
ncbi:hypothetical protein MSKOL_2881 [Methanosarcina sp. Kolksee]|nr:hypothetical protein MSKOL_2881 [Methanosarcina sp. Kolksee]